MGSTGFTEDDNGAVRRYDIPDLASITLLDNVGIEDCRHPRLPNNLVF